MTIKKNRGCPGCGEWRRRTARDNHGEPYQAYDCNCIIADVGSVPVGSSSMGTAQDPRLAERQAIVRFVREWSISVGGCDDADEAQVMCESVRDALADAIERLEHLKP